LRKDPRLLERLRGLVDLQSPLTPLLAVVLCLLIGMGMVFSILAVYVQSLGAPSSMVGVMLACFGGARLAVNLPAGLASERFGRRAVMLGGLGVLTIGSFGAAATTDIALLLACLFAQGAGTSAFVTAALAAVADLGTPETRMRDMAAYQGAQLGGISIGPALGGLTVAYGGYTAVFLLQGAMVVLALLLLVRSTAIGTARNAAPRSRTRAQLPAGAIGLASVTYGVFFARIAANWVLMPLLARDQLGMSVTAIGLLLTLGALANFAVLPFSARLAKRVGRTAVVIATNLMTILSLVLLASVHAEPVLWATGVLLGATSGLAAPTLSAITADAAPPGQLGAAMGFMRTLTDLGIVSGPILTGIVVDRLGYGYAGGLIASAVVLAAATAIFALAKRRTVHA
jgi:MFS family permease